MNNYRFLVIIIAFICSDIKSQNIVTLDWKDIYEKNYLISSFQDAVYFSSNNGLPSFQSIIETDGKNEFIVKINNESFINVSDFEEKILKDLEIEENIKVCSDILISNHEYYHRTSFFPYIVVGRQYKKLSSFSYTISTYKDRIIKKEKRVKINSVLSSSDWRKISVSQSGVYKITFSDLQNLEINTLSLPVSSIKIFGNAGGMLPRNNSEFRHEDLVENAIEIVDNNSNNIFEEGDLILFYGEDIDQWSPDENNIGRYHHHKHLYDDANYYFLTVNNTGSGKRIQQYITTLKGNIKTSDVFNAHEFHELDLVNFIQSGSNWHGEVFDEDLKQFFSFNFPNIVDNSEVYINANVSARAWTPSSFSFYTNSTNILDIPLGVITSGNVNDYVTQSSLFNTFIASSDVIDIEVNFNRSSSSHKGWLDYIEVCGFRNLVMEGSQMNFRKTMNSGGNQLYSLIIDNFSENDRIWNVTDPVNVKEHNMENYSGNKYSFSYDMFSGLSDQKFIAFDGSDYLSPTFLGEINNQNLHGETDCDMLIVSHSNFLNAAEKLKNHHSVKNNKKCKIVTPEQIYNEFSSGKQDVSAIRDYAKYLYHLPNSNFKHLLLIGDASYDPKQRINNNTNFVITYQSENSISPLNTFATDDYFGYLDLDEGLLTNDLVDIGIGRLPCQTLAEANAMVDKIINYHHESSMGEWKNMIAFIADDGDENDGNIHMSQAETLSNIVDDNYNNFNFDKIYLDAFNQESTPIGPRSVSASLAITNRVEKGALLINYTGHGGEGGLTQERIVEVDQIIDWNNGSSLPLFVTATCEFGRFDNPARTSAGEYIILNPDGGGVGLLTTTRYVYSHLNFNLNTHFINTVFEKEDGMNQALGEVFRKTKILSGSSINSSKFILLGDPLLSLSSPVNQVTTTICPDTMNALSKITIHGEIITQDSVKLSDFNGTLYSTIFDKEIIAKTQGQESSTPMSYRKQDNVLYKGISTISNGEFNFTFIVPKDIDYNFDNGRISFYAASDLGKIDASGWNEDFIIGGVSDNFENDDIGPSIELYLNDKQFISGGLTNSDPILLAFLQDSSGINTLGNGIGHDITATIDGENAKKIILNEYYVSDRDSYQNGKVEYSLKDLAPGRHTIDFKVWDVFNNSSSASIEFFVAETEDFVINHLLNYPNPFSLHTDFYFEHNRPNQLLEIQIQIFTVTGRLVKTINRLENSKGFRVGPISWNGLDDFGDYLGRGTYIYKVRVEDQNGEDIEKYEKLVILR